MLKLGNVQIVKVQRIRVGICLQRLFDLLDFVGRGSGVLVQPLGFRFGFLSFLQGGLEQRQCLQLLVLTAVFSATNCSIRSVSSARFIRHPPASP